MSYTDYLKELLRPLGVYDVDAPFNGGELTAAGEALDGAFGALEEVERESSLLTARSWGLEGLAALLLHRPAAETEEGLGQALAALLRIGDDSFTPAAINDTIVGCGVAAECTETGVGRVRVRFPGVVGVPAQIDRLKQIIQEDRAAPGGERVVLPLSHLGGAGGAVRVLGSAGERGDELE